MSSARVYRCRPTRIRRVRDVRRATHGGGETRTYPLLLTLAGTFLYSCPFFVLNVSPLRTRLERIALARESYVRTGRADVFLSRFWSVLAAPSRILFSYCLLLSQRIVR